MTPYAQQYGYTPTTFIPHHLQFQTLTTLTEQEFRQECKDISQQMLNKMSVDEQMKVAFVPLVIQHIIFTYAGNFTKYCADNRKSEYKKECREIKQLHADLLFDMKKDLDSVHIKKIVNETERFTNNCHKDLMILYFCVNGEVKKKHPKVDDVLFTYAFITLVLVMWLHHYTKKMNELVKARLGRNDDAFMHPSVYKLIDVMQSVTGNRDIDCGGHIDTCLAILDKEIVMMEFEVK